VLDFICTNPERIAALCGLTYKVGFLVKNKEVKMFCTGITVKINNMGVIFA